PRAVRGPLLDAVQRSFMSGLHTGCIVAAGVCALGALGALALPGRHRPGAVEQPLGHTALEPSGA
ncbi:MAG: MFS transporter, partial [Solirubrobacterales bacterium]|nr:MFS transporter [Solirubrobacterales bacterium]